MGVGKKRGFGKMIQFDKEIIIAIVSALIIGCGVYYLVNKEAKFTALLN